MGINKGFTVRNKNKTQMNVNIKYNSVKLIHNQI